MLYDVEILQSSDIWMLLEELNDKRDVVFVHIIHTALVEENKI